MSAATPTSIACLTPPGTAAIATLALRGPDAWNVVRELFHVRSPRHPLPAEPEIGRIWLGRLGAEAADEVVLTVKRLVPVPWVELHCHGGREVIQMLLETFEAHGLRTCTWQQLERLTTDDPLRAEAAVALAGACTTRTAAILLDQHQGAFRRAVDAVLEALDRNDAAEADRLLSELARYADVGRHLTIPWRVAIAGAPNVGKSSLVNALAGYQRCVIAATPGTTRDVVTTLIALDGWPVELIDTAGLRGGAEALEEQGIRLARETAAAADLCLWLLDASEPPVWPFGDSRLRLAANMRLVVNKVDQPNAWELREAADAVHVSALTGTGLGELCEALTHWLAPDPPSPGAAVPFTPLLCDRIEEARRHLAADGIQAAREVLKLS